MTKKWLDDAEQAAWQSLLKATALLDGALDEQLRRDSGINHATFGILASLSGAPDHTLHMQQLASLSRSSQSRLSHAVARLEEDDLVLRSPCPHNRRGVHATLTPQGLALVKAAAPGHVALVRRMVFDRLTASEVAQLTAITGKVVDALAEAGHEVAEFGTTD